MEKIKIRRSIRKIEQENSSNFVVKNGLLLSWRSYFFSIIYFISGIFLFISLFFIFNTYVFHLKVETAVVSEPIETMVAPLAGYIKDVLVLPGSHVHKGDLLVKIENIELERDSELANLRMEDAQLNVTYIKSLLANEQKKMDVYKIIGSNRVASSEATLDFSKQQVIESNNNLKRIQALVKKHFASVSDLDKAVTEDKIAEGKMKNAYAMENIENYSLNAINNGMYFTGDRLEGLISDLNAQVNAAEMRLSLEKKRTEIYKNLLQKLNLFAPFDGDVTQILKSVGNTTDNIKPIIMLTQDNSPKTIVAWLTQNEITHIRLSSKVKVYIPSLQKFYFGKIIQINRTSGFVDEINAQFRWRDLQIDRSATVLVTIDRGELNKFNQSVSAGMPAIVYFRKNGILT